MGKLYTMNVYLGEGIQQIDYKKGLTMSEVNAILAKYEILWVTTMDTLLAVHVKSA
jgi:hypothetical protein